MAIWDNLVSRLRQSEDEFVDDYDEYVDTTSSAVTEAEAEASYSPKSEKVINMRSSMSMGGSRLIVLKPKDYNDVMGDAVRFLREGAIVCLNLEQVTAEARKRIVDFMTGAIAALDGKMEKISSCTYTVTPKNVTLEGDLTELEQFD